MIKFDEIKKEVDQGIQGLNLGIPFGQDLDRMTSYTCGIVKEKYTLFGGNTGTGKTALVDQMYCIGPIEFLEKNPEFPFKLHIPYYSLEIPAKRKLIKWTCWKMYRDYGILIDSKTLIGRSLKNTVSQETYDIFMKTREWVENIQKWVKFHNFGSPNSIHRDLVTYFSAVGKTERRQVQGEDGVVRTVDVYIPNDPTVITNCITDHLGNMNFDTNVKSKKENIDTKSANSVKSRNFYGCSHTDISQFNREIGDIKRKTFSELMPQLEDFKDTSNSQEDADDVYCIFDPNRYNLDEYMSYNLKILRDNFRAFFVLKGRDVATGAGKIVALQFIGECGHFKELPKSDVFVQSATKGTDLYREIKNKITNVRRGDTTRTTKEI